MGETENEKEVRLVSEFLESRPLTGSSALTAEVNSLKDQLATANKKLCQDCEECSGLAETDLTELVATCKELRKQLATAKRDALRDACAKVAEMADSQESSTLDAQQVYDELERMADEAVKEA